MLNMCPHPTLTHVPPNLAPSMTMALTPYFPLAALAEAIPPLPPPRTRKSVSLMTGAMAKFVVEKCLDKLVVRAAAILEDKTEGRVRRTNDRMGGKARWVGFAQDSSTAYWSRGRRGINMRRQNKGSEWRMFTGNLELDEDGC